MSWLVALVLIAVVDQLDAGVAAVEIQTPSGVKMRSINRDFLPSEVSEGDALEIHWRRSRRAGREAEPLLPSGLVPEGMRVRRIKPVKQRPRSRS